MVGIAGGIPFPESPEQHVRLGDVVVSNKCGVVQYDNLKVGVGKIVLRSLSSRPSARMTGAVRLLESERIMKKCPWEAFLPLASKLEGAGRPPEEADRLYRWEDGKAVLTNHPVDPTRQTDRPRVHYGPIGASNLLLKHAPLRDQLRRDCDVIAIEMEASGIADATWTAGQGYLIIRGICDYCDDSKNDLWQGHAALVAAAYARALISSISVASYKNGAKKT